MKIAIIGAGFTGLSAAYYLQKLGHDIVVFEKEENPGGLAIGYKEDSWNWALEEHYHHWFTNDKNILDLAREIGHKVIIKRPKTSSFVNNKIYQLDSPVSLLKFPELSLIDRLRTGFSIAFLRYNPFWKMLESSYAEPYLKQTMGNNAYNKIWKPLMVNKLGKYSDSVSLAWFWARVFKRTPSLAYPEGGFLNFAKNLESAIKKNGGEFIYRTEVVEIRSNEKIIVKYKLNGKLHSKDFDKTIVTLPTFLFTRLAPQLPKKYVNKYSKLIGIGAVNLVLRLKKNFLKDGTYWLNMCDLKSPILAIVEHTNFMNKKNYDDEHLLYIGNYMEITDPRYSLNDKELLKIYAPWLKKINNDYTNTIIDSKVFKAPFAQPIIPINYSSKIPTLKTPLKNVYLANIQQVYPWDRGTNYAVELGKKAAESINNYDY